MLGYIKIYSINDVSILVDSAKRSPCRVTIHHNQRIIDGCSLMGVLSVGTAGKVEVRANGDEADINRFFADIKNLVVSV